MTGSFRYASYTDQTGRARLTPRQARRFAKKDRRDIARLVARLKALNGN